MSNPPILGPGSSGTSAADCTQLKADIARYQSLVDFLNRSLASISDPLARKSLESELATASKVLEDTQANYTRHCLPAPRPTPAFTLNPWQLSTPFGIHLDNGQWNSGSVNAVCPISGNRLLIGTEQGGLWISEPDGRGGYNSRSLSDSWLDFRFTCFVADPANPNRIFAGSAPGFGGDGGVYVGDTGLTFDDWVYIPLPTSFHSLALPGGAGQIGVSSMIILPLQRLLLVAAGGGLGWTSIDSMPFAWQTDLRGVEQLANLPNDAFLFVGDDSKVPLASKPTLNIGQISGGKFTSVLVPASAIQWVHRSAPTNIEPLQIATCRDHSQNAYCLGTVDDGSETGLMYILQSQTSGATWSECSYVTNKPDDLGKVLGFPESSPGPKSDTSIAVHPTYPLLVAAGYGGGALSQDGGMHWIDLTDLDGWHDDIHHLYFDGPSDSLWIPNDGGIFRLSNASSQAPNSGNVDTSRNRTLPVVMFYAPNKTPTGAFGNLAVGAGMLAAGSQDNADLWADPTLAAWQVAGGGDGGAVAIFPRGSDTYLLYGQSSQIPVRWSQRQGNAMGPHQTIPVRLGWAAIDGSGIDPTFLRPVWPQVGLVTGPNNSPVIALASPAKSNVIYGAVFDNAFLDNVGTVITGQMIEWAVLGQIPTGEVIASLEAHASGSVLAGTVSGRLFLVQVGGDSSEVSLDQKPGGAIMGIASDGTTVVCFDQLTASFSSAKPGFLYVGQIAAQPLTRLNTTLCPPNTGSSEFFGIAANRNVKFLTLSFAVIANQNEVWVSNSPLGVLWHKWVSGLPFATNGSDIVITESPTNGEIWLSTYGRGVWRLPFA
jgi:hypothetical protein